jgi:hypothetical protein
MRTLDAQFAQDGPCCDDGCCDGGGCDCGCC